VAIDAIDLQRHFDDEDSSAKMVWQMWQQYDQLRGEAKAGWKEVDTYLMATDTTTTTNVSNEFNHTTHRPKLTQIYDNLTANYKPGLIPNRNWVHWIGEDQEAVSKQNRRLLESYVRTKHRLSGFSEVVDELLDDWIRTGNCFCGVDYVNDQHVAKNGKVLQGYKGPKIYRISPHDIVFNPFATSFANSNKIVRSVHSMGDLHKRQNSATNGELYRTVLQKLKDDRGYVAKNSASMLNLKGPGTEEVEKYVQATWDGFGSYMSYMQSGHVEILEMYGDFFIEETGEFLSNHKIVVADRRYVLAVEPIQTWNGKAPIFHSAWRKRPENIWGQGPLDKLVGLQYRIDHLENMRADAFDKAQDPDRVFTGDVEVDYSETGSKEYTIADGNGDVHDLPIDTTILTASMEIQEIEAAMDLYAGSPREAMGFRTPGEKTKFEVSQLMNAAGRIFQHKLERFEVQILEPAINCEIDLARQANDQKDTVEIMLPNGAVNFQQISSEDLYMNGRYIPIGARHYSRQQQLAQDARDMFEMILQDPSVLQHFPSKKLAKLFEELMGFDEHDLYQEYGRLYEQLELEKLKATAMEQLQNEAMVPTEEEDDIVEAEGEPDASNSTNPFEALQEPIQ
jgi:hypothetical protein